MGPLIHGARLCSCWFLRSIVAANASITFSPNNESAGMKLHSDATHYIPTAFPSTVHTLLTKRHQSDRTGPASLRKSLIFERPKIKGYFLIWVYTPRKALKLHT